MTRVDTNIFRDISTTPNMVPDDESLAYELRDEKDIKVMRMKSCAYTLKAVFAAQVWILMHLSEVFLIAPSQPFA